MNYHIVNCYDSIGNFVRLVEYSNFSEYSVDLEGELHRNGHISYITVYIPDQNETFIFDCNQLSKGQIKYALDRVLNNHLVKKYMFDCRSDSDALFHIYDIILISVIDVQLYEVGYRKCKGKKGTERYRSLSDTLTTYKDIIKVSNYERNLKNSISSQFKNGFRISLNDACIQYMIVDVKYLKSLFMVLSRIIGNGKIKRKIIGETCIRENYWRLVSPLYGRLRAFSEI